LPILVELHPEVILDQGGEPDAAAAEQLCRQHRVKQALGPEAAEIAQEPQVEVTAVHHQVFLRQLVPEGVQVDRRQRVDKEYLAVHVELQQADPHAKPVHVVRLCIHDHLAHLVERRQEGLKLPGLVDQSVA